MVTEGGAHRCTCPRGVALRQMDHVHGGRVPRRAGPAAADLRTLVRGLDPTAAMADVRAMSAIVSGATAERRFQMLLLTAFGGAALFLSLVGLYAMTTYSVEQRTAGIGIRMALGAQPHSVMRLILSQGSQLTFAGIVPGFACAWLATPAGASLLFEVKHRPDHFRHGRRPVLCSVRSCLLRSRAPRHARGSSAFLASGIGNQSMAIHPNPHKKYWILTETVTLL